METVCHPTPGRLCCASIKRFPFVVAASLGICTAGWLAAPQVVGADKRWVESLPHPQQWEFVRANADGFYVDFIAMDHAAPGQFNDMAKLMGHKVAFLESDAHHATAAADQRSLQTFQTGRSAAAPRRCAGRRAPAAGVPCASGGRLAVGPGASRDLRAFR